MRRRTESTEAKLIRSLGKSKSLIVADQNLAGINLSRRVLLGIEFRRCTLSGANFSGSDLSLARFIDCDLYMADFSESVLYTTWFYECNLTKATFRKAYLLGFRLRNADLTKTEFDDVPAVGLERKSRYEQLRGDLRLPLMGVLPINAQKLEGVHAGIGMTGFNRVIYFISEKNDSGPRVKIRAAETARYLRNAHA